MKRKALLKYADGRMKNIKIPAEYDSDGDIVIPETVTVEETNFRLDPAQHEENKFHYSEESTNFLH